MQTPICEVCLKSDILCNACQNKLEQGIINQDEIEIARYLYRLSEKMKSIRDVNILRIINSDALIIITGRGDAPKLVGKAGAVVKKIANRFRKSIRILEESSNLEDFVEELIFPTTVNGINTLYRNNEEIIRIRVPAIQKNHLLLKPESFSKIISNFYNKKAELIFEL